MDVPIGAKDVFDKNLRVADGQLTVDEAGSLFRAGSWKHYFDVPRAREHRYFGATFVEVDAIPLLWRPLHARSGVIVTKLAQQSPLAQAGVKPFDAIRSVQGVAVSRAEDMVQRLNGAPPDVPFTIEIVHAKTGALDTVTVRRSSPLGEATSVWIPLIFLRITRAESSYNGVGPLDALFTTWTTVKCDTEEQPEGSTEPRPERTVATGVSVFFYGFRYEEKTFHDRGVKRRRLTIFWIIPISLGEEPLDR